MVHLFNHFLHQSTAYKQKQIKIQTGWPTLFCLRYLFIYLFTFPKQPAIADSVAGGWLRRQEAGESCPRSRQPPTASPPCPRGTAQRVTMAARSRTPRAPPNRQPPRAAPTPGAREEQPRGFPWRRTASVAAKPPVPSSIAVPGRQGVRTAASVREGLQYGRTFQKGLLVGKATTFPTGS